MQAGLNFVAIRRWQGRFLKNEQYFPHMILTSSEIEKQIALKKIQISPFCKTNLNPNSYNYRLGPTLLEITDPVIDPKRATSYREIAIPKQGFLLLPNHLYLGSTLEKIGSSDYVPTLIGRSSLGRLGLFLQITADLGQLGTYHPWTLELKVVQPLWVYPGMAIGQVCFWQPEGKRDLLYQGKYHKNLNPACSKLHQELYCS
jgi:dCTP deaminase